VEFGLGELTSSLLFFASLALLTVSLVVDFWRGHVPGAVTVDADAIAIRRGGATRRIARSSIRSAYRVARDARGEVVSTVELELDTGDVASFEVPSEEARRIVDDLGFGRGKKRIHVALASPARRLLHVPFALVAYYIVAYYVGMIAVLAQIHQLPSPSNLASFAFWIAMGILARALLRAPQVTIGDDGVAYRSGLTRRFVPGAGITAVEEPSVGLPLLVTSARERPLAIDGMGLDPDRRTAVGRIACERFVGPASLTKGGAAKFARGGRTLAAWREYLRARSLDVGYREVAAPDDDPAAVLHSPRSTGEERVGAALALRVAGEPEERIRIAASAVADDELRAALETIAEGEVNDDAGIQRVLRKVLRAGPGEM
jgi:hypothetical protein